MTMTVITFFKKILFPLLRKEYIHSLYYVKNIILFVLFELCSLLPYIFLKRMYSKLTLCKITILLHNKLLKLLPTSLRSAG